MSRVWLWRAQQFIKWLVKSKTCYSVHSSFLYDLCVNTFHQPFFESNWLFERWKSLVPEGVRSEALKSSIHPFDAKLLIGISRFINPANILEVGTGYGFSTVVLHHAVPHARLLTFEKESERSQIARSIFWTIFPYDIVRKKVAFSTQQFPPDGSKPDLENNCLAFVDGGHNRHSMEKTIQWLMNNLPKRSVIVLHDIYWSSEMLDVWRRLFEHDRTTFWIDMFRLGIVVLDYPAKKKKIYLRPGPPLFVPL